MKVLLIGFFTRTYMPYLEKYENVLLEQKVSYDIVFFERDSTLDDVIVDGNEYTFAHKTTASRFQKMIPMLNYASFVRKKIKTGEYDKIIVFTTIPAIMCENLLLHKYRERYIYDYRDTTYEHFKFFKRKVKRLIEGSYFTAVSSYGYSNVLGESKKILYNHNISNIEDEVKQAKTLDGIITIGFLGYVRYPDVNQRLIDALSNNEKYKMLYVGTQFSDCDLGKYADEINANNVVIKGKYDNRDKASLYTTISIINSMYSLNSNEVQYAIPNRLYDAALFKIPLMTTKGTYLSEITEKYGLGFSVDPFFDDIKETIDTYIDKFNAVQFEEKCKLFLEKVYADEHKLDNEVRAFLL